MKARLTVLIAVLLSGPAAAQERTADVLADKFLLQATQALERGDREEALQAFREIEALDVEPPAMFAYRYGRMLVEQGAGATDWRKGRSLLTRFAIRVGRGSEHYPSALELLLAANAALEVVESPTRLEERLPDVRRGVDAQLVRVEGGSFAMGCTPEQEGAAPTTRSPCAKCGSAASKSPGTRRRRKRGKR